jgi:hypothetical protein
MSRSTLSRLTRLEQSGTDRRTSLLVAASQGEASKLQALHPGAMAIVTGVQRSVTETPR